MKRRNHWLLFAILLLALINLSPSKSTSSINTKDANNTEVVTVPNLEKIPDEGHIKVVVQMDDDAFLHLQQMNEAYMNVHPLQVDLVNEPPESTYSSLQLQLELGESPDVLLLDNVWIRRYAAEGYLLPTENYYFGSLTGEVLSTSLVQNEWNSYVWGVPLDVDPYVFVYNPDLLKELGLESLPKSVEEWEKLISDFKNQSNTPHLLGLNYDDPYAMMSLLWQLGGGNQIANEISPFALTEEMKTGIRQMEVLRPYLLNELEIESAGEIVEDVWKKFYNGEVAIILTRASEAQETQRPSMEVSLPEPTDTVKTMWIGGRSYVVSAQTDNAEAAGSWISEMTSQAQQRDWYETTGYLPVLKSLYYDFSRNGIPEWVSASLVNRQGGTLPVGIALPNQMDKFSVMTGEFASGVINSKEYMTQLSQIEE